LYHTIDINCDMGEGFGPYKLGNDSQLLEYVTSANIACGYHAGDHHVMFETVKLAAEKGVAIGAHPGFLDKMGFGRREIQISPREVYQLVLYQIGALQAFTKVFQTELHHVKPHGALYNMAAKNEAIARAIVQAIYDFNPNLILYGLSGSILTKVAKEKELKTAEEVFADRTYQDDGSLTPRTESNAIITNVDEAIERVIKMIKTGTIVSTTGRVLPIQADTICIHSDHDHSYLFAKTLKEKLIQSHIQLKAMSAI